MCLSTLITGEITMYTGAIYDQHDHKKFGLSKVGDKGKYQGEYEELQLSVESMGYTGRGTWYNPHVSTGWQLKIEGTIVLKDFATMTSILRNINNEVTRFKGNNNKFDTPEEIVEQMQSLESQLVGLGYNKTESAVFEKSVMETITI